MRKTWFVLVVSLAALGCGVGGVTSDEVAMSEDELSAATVCPATACGPQPGMPSRVCADGSVGGFTGRCISARRANRCVWEIRPCPRPPPVQCGTATCAAGQVCCNASCGICAGPNDACIQVVCPPPPRCTATQCGPVPPTTCASTPPTCEADATGACHWVDRCPPPPPRCSPTQCGPAPASPCPASCEADPAGVCRWVVQCPPPPVVCGQNTCRAGEVCCSPSCGLCVPAGGACPAIACPPPPPPACAATDCGPVPPLCSATVVPTCERDSAGVCRWNTHGCPPPPPPPCAATDCGPLPPPQCAVTVMPTCERDPAGTCRWNTHCPPAPCTNQECGPMPASPTYTCWDGSTGGNLGRCERDRAGVCGWLIRPCPPPPPPPAVCPSTACGPRPGVATQICADGSLGGFTGQCLPVATSTGTTSCQWEIRPCP